MEYSNLYEKIKSTAIQNPEVAVFRFKEDKKWKTVSYSFYLNQSEKLAHNLLKLGIKKGDVIASFSNNCVALNILDLALLKIGAIHALFFPNYTVNNLIDAIEYIQPKFVFGNTGMFLSNLLKAKEHSTYGFDIYSLNKNKKNIISLSEIINQEITISQKCTEVFPQDYYSIYFTSGTTGNPKGALITNQAIVQTIDALQKTFPVHKNETAVSIAPLSVSSERCLNYYYQCSAVTTYYMENMEQIVYNIQDAKPSIFLTSPLMLHKIRENIYAKKEELSSGFKKKLLNKALVYAENESHIKKKTISKFIYDKLIYSKFRNILGGKVRFIVSGGAASSKATLVFCHNIGIPVYEGYGMTECHTIAVNHPQTVHNTYNNVGTAFGETEIKISNEGEVLCRSPYMFNEYYNLPEITKNSFTDDGFFKTGDKGQFDRNKHLIINGRIKNIFKTMAGIYINPEGIEAYLLQSPLFEQVIILGENKKHLTALIYPNENLRRKTIDETKMSLWAIIEKYNNTKVEAEQIRDFQVLSSALTIEKREMTASLKPVRKVIEQHYQKEIAEMYAN